MEETNAEEEKHQWCTTEMTTNTLTRKNKSKAAEDLRADIESLQAEIAEQSEKIQELNAAVVASDQAVASATQQRATEKARNAETIKDAAAAQDAVSQALVVLKEFYGNASNAEALMQAPSTDAPVTWDSAYQGQQGSATGIVGMIEVIQSDFVRLETETTSAESIASKEHQEFLDDSAQDKAVKDAESAKLDSKRARNESTLSSTQKDLRNVEAELKAANDYYDTLKPQCIAAPGNYNDRKVAREEEIQSLKEALQILSDE